MLAGGHIKKKIRERALEARSPAFVNREARPGNSCRGGDVQDSGGFPNFPMRLRGEMEFRGPAPPADLHIVSGAGADGHARMWDVRNGEEQLVLRGIQL